MSSITPITIYPSVVSKSDQFFAAIFERLKTKKNILIVTLN
jgi:hypothetical protein